MRYVVALVATLLVAGNALAQREPQVLQPYPPGSKLPEPQILQPYPPGYTPPPPQVLQPYPQGYPAQQPYYPQPYYPQPYYPQPYYPQPYYPQPYYPQPYGYPAPPPNYPGPGYAPAPRYGEPTPPPLVAPQPYGQPVPPYCLLPPPKPIKKNRGLFKLSLGYGYRWAIGADFHSAAAEIMFGSENDHAGGGGRFGLEVGRTYSGLSFEALSFGAGFEFKLSRRWRIGFGPTIGILIIQRATRSDDDFWAFTLGTHLDLSVDLVQTRTGGALYLAGRAGYDFVVPTTDLDGSSFIARLWLGYRF
jgi:hypothetical protein